MGVRGVLHDRRPRGPHLGYNCLFGQAPPPPLSSVIMRLTIAHMPGAGGTALLRLLSPDPGLLAPYPPPHPTQGYRHSWLPFENPVARGTQQGHPRDRVDAQHTREPAWLRITVTSREEWWWCCGNALWKGSHIHAGQLASDPALQSRIQLPLRIMWDWQLLWPLLRPLLGLLKHPELEERRHQDWRDWRGTWCPHIADPEWMSQCDQWRPLLPEYLSDD